MTMTEEFRDSSTVFVYGTLRPGQPNFSAVQPYVEVRDRAALTGWQLWALPDGYPTILPGDGSVVGTLLGLDEQGRARRTMNRIEGYDPAGESLYRPLPVEVETDGDDRVETFTYVLAEQRRDRARARGRLVDHGDWIQWSTDREP